MQNNSRRKQVLQVDCCSAIVAPKTVSEHSVISSILCTTRLFKIKIITSIGRTSSLKLIGSSITFHCNNHHINWLFSQFQESKSFPYVFNFVCSTNKKVTNKTKLSSQQFVNKSSTHNWVLQSSNSEDFAFKPLLQWKGAKGLQFLALDFANHACLAWRTHYVTT